MSSSTHDNAFAFQTKVHLFASPSRHITLNSALQKALSISTMPARRQRDQFHLIHWCNNEVTIDDEGENQKKTNLANKQATHQTSLFPMTDRKSTILNSFLTRLTYQISHFGKTQPSVDLVFKSSLMNWECLCIFQNSTTKYCRRSQKIL